MKKIILLSLTILGLSVANGQPPPPISCSITGTNPVIYNDVWTYTLTSACTATGWTCSCGTILSYTANTVDIQFNGSGCSSALIRATGTTGSLTVTIIPQLVGGTISNPTQTINNNTTPAQISASAASGGTGTYSYQWYSSTNGSSYSTVSGATSQNYQPGSLTTTTYYKRLTTSGTQTAYTTNVATVTVYPPLVAGTVTPSTQQINYNTVPGMLTGSSASGGSGSYTYQWVTWTGTNWVSVSGATSITYTPPALTQNATYVLQYTSNGVTVNSNTVTINVYPQLIGGAVTPSTQQIYSGFAPGMLTGSLPSGGSGTYYYQWVYWTGVNWLNVPGATSITYTPGALTQTTSYVLQYSSNGVVANSNTVTVTVVPELFIGMISPSAATIPSGSDPGDLTVTPTTGGNCSGAYSYQWQSSSNGVSWSTISGATGLYYDPGALTATTWFRVQNICSTDTEYIGPSKITVGPAPTSLNFIRERTLSKAGVSDTVTADALTSPLDVGQTTQYFDGLGRLMQTVQKQASPLGFDMVGISAYDPLGREVQKYLPYASPSSDGNYKANAFGEQYTFNATQFPNDQFYYGAADYEASALNRPLTTFQPGYSWVQSGRGVSNNYLVNDATDSVQMWNIDTTAGSLPTDAGVYSAGTLYKNVTTDEQGHQIIEYKDKHDKVILKKVQLSASPGTAHVGWLCTYYVYDNLLNIRFVIPPSAVQSLDSANTWSFSQALANELCFRYEYDYRKLMIIKKVPGAGETRMVYDARDRLVMTQDSSLRAQQKWLVTCYDAMNRPDSTALIADPTNYNNLAYHENLAAGSTAYPNTGSYTTELLTRTFYDNYSWVSGTGTSLSSSIASNDTSNSTYFITTYNTSPSYSVPLTPFAIPRGLQTGSMRKVLGTSPAQYLYDVSWYDDHGRVIQTQSINYTRGIDTLMTQYTFTGNPLRNLEKHQKDSNTVQHHILLTKLDYDALFRPRHIWKNIDAAASDQLIDSMQYNELGQLKAKFLGNQVDSLIYAYNIRGWLTGINPNYIAGTTAHYFGMELGYDRTTSLAAGNTYLAPQYNGNIEGIVWKSAGCGINRKYDFTYDNTNRLTSAAYLQNSTGTSWDNSLLNFSVGNLTYDPNGNILSMTQDGFKVGGSSAIDSLIYRYFTKSNKLSGVSDSANIDSSQLGDFHYNHLTKQSTDYAYDGNGNLTLDNNKGITGIGYNYLNLPQWLHINGKGNIQYVYDAAGAKLAKFTYDSLIKHSTTTLYIGPFVYQQSDTITSTAGGTDTLQFINHEEGRARWAYHKYTQVPPAYGWEYDFFEKDHLGNTRTVLTQQRDTANYLASMEAAYRSTESQLFANIAATCVAFTSMPGYSSIPSGSRYYATNPNDSVSKVDYNGTSGQTTGPSLLLKVMSGDTIKLGVQSYYNTGSGSTNNSSFTAVLNSLAAGIVNLAGTSHGTFSNLTSSGSSVYTGLTSFLSTDDPSTSGYPKAYLNWIFLDDQFQYVSSLSGSVQAASSTYPAGTLNSVAPGSELHLNENGYIYIWVSNETQGWDVFFDNLSVQHRQGPLLEENHYYPFGLTMAALCDKAVKTQYSTNKFRYNGKELQSQEFSDGSGLEEYDYGERLQDPQLGVWHNIDPKTEQMRRFSSYIFAFDNPLRFIDPDGNGPEDVILKGPQQVAAFTELQKSVQGQLTLTMDDNGKVSYTKDKNTDPCVINVGAHQLATAIDDHTVNVNINTVTPDPTPNGQLAGSFMGNTVTDQNVVPAGQSCSVPVVNTNQVVNVDDLKTISDYYEKPGADMLHETVESYIGAKKAQESGVSASSPPTKAEYDAAHAGATDAGAPQSGKVEYRLIDRSGNITTDRVNYRRLEVFIKAEGKSETIIRSWPNNSH